MISNKRKIERGKKRVLEKRRRESMKGNSRLFIFPKDRSKASLDPTADPVRHLKSTESEFLIAGGAENFNRYFGSVCHHSQKQSVSCIAYRVYMKYPNDYCRGFSIPNYEKIN